MTFHFVDINRNLVRAWKEDFRPFRDVEIVEGDILALARDTIVSPANSYGYMDGGIYLQYMKYFGERIQTIVQEVIGTRSQGLLPVGSSILVLTGDERIPRLIVAPTMEFPEQVGATNAYRAMRAVLRIADKKSAQISHIYCPGLATGTGMVEPEDAATQMASAFRGWIESKSADKSI